MSRCEGRPPDGVCLAKIINNSVVLCQGDLMLCKECENFRFPPMPPMKSASGVTPVNVSGGDAQNSVKSDEQHVGDNGDRCTKLSSAGAVTTDVNAHLTNQPSLMQCELLYFMMGCYGQHPESTVKTSILQFYREDEILHEKQLLVQAAKHIDTCNIQSFIKTRTGNNKCKSSVDDIFNTVRVIDEHSLRDKLPTFCAVNRIRVPVIAEELSDMAAVRLELNQLRQLVESLANQLSSVSQSKRR